jgi:hypothetical protein
MFARCVIPTTALAVLILSAPASAAGAGPSATPLIVELVLAALVIAGVAIRRPVARLLAAARRRLSPRTRRAAAAARARGA